MTKEDLEYLSKTCNLTVETQTVHIKAENNYTTVSKDCIQCKKRIDINFNYCNHCGKLQKTHEPFESDSTKRIVLPRKKS